MQFEHRVPGPGFFSRGPLGTAQMTAPTAQATETPKEPSALWFTYAMTVPRTSKEDRDRNIVALTLQQAEERASSKKPLFERLQHKVDTRSEVVRIVKPYLDSDRKYGKWPSEIDIQGHLDDFKCGICKLFEPVTTFSWERDVISHTGTGPTLRASLTSPGRNTSRLGEHSCWVTRLLTPRWNKPS